MKNKVYEITYMYELENQEYVGKSRPDLGIRVSKSFTARCELVTGKTSTQAISKWEKKMHKREPKANVYITDIKEHSITTSSEN